MARDKLIILGVVVLGFLGFLVFQQAKKDEALGQPLATAKDFPPIAATADIDKISPTNGEKGEIVREKVPHSKAPRVDGGAFECGTFSRTISPFSPLVRLILRKCRTQ